MSPSETSSRRFLASLLLAGVAMGGCKPEPEKLPPLGEVLVEIDTDLPVPQFLSRIRVDLFTSEQAWFASRDFALPDPSDLPISFSVFTPLTATEADFVIRVRGYPDGKTRDYRGERFTPRPTFTEPASAGTLSEACTTAPRLGLGQELTLRLARNPFPDGSKAACGSSGSRSGLAAARLDVAAKDSYRIEVVRASPEAEFASLGDTVLSLRRACADASTEVACNDNLDDTYNLLSGTTVTLDPGSYFVVVGNRIANPADVTLRAARTAAWDAPPSSAAASPPASDAGTGATEKPRLLQDGLDITPETEPAPALAVDRLATVRVEQGQLGTARLLLSGECVGTMADLESAKTCIDTEGQLEPLTRETIAEGHLHATASRVGSWAAAKSRPCVSSPRPAGGKGRDGTELDDEQVCAKGGAFTLGDATIVEFGPENGTPERVAVMSPFLIDRYEMTVARYRAATAAGFVSPDGTPEANAEPIAYDPANLTTRQCTYNEGPDGRALFPERERMPLNCVSWYSARALCRFLGEDLPTVAQLEFVAAHGAEGEGGGERLFPWGAAEPDCDSVVFGRWGDDTTGTTKCFSKGFGPVPVASSPWALADKADSGVVGLGGNVSEWTLDAHHAYGDPCWLANGLRDPQCWEEEAPLRAAKGTAWRLSQRLARSAARIRGAPSGSEDVFGVRCVKGDKP